MNETFAPRPFQQRAPYFPIAAIKLGICPHSSVFLLHVKVRFRVRIRIKVTVRVSVRVRGGIA